MYEVLDFFAFEVVIYTQHSILELEILLVFLHLTILAHIKHSGQTTEQFIVSVPRRKRWTYGLDMNDIHPTGISEKCGEFKYSSGS